MVLLLKQIAFLLVHGSPGALWPDEELGVPPKKPVLELEDVPTWDFEVIALGKGINPHYMQEERCVDTWADKRAICSPLSAFPAPQPPFLGRISFIAACWMS